ncbi:hypothetical protein EYF80_031968 [Liparis tanakae]|uniref:Uncharacterized protein n=1 Tax=Liparis tanakae TaxID=230148 RepID=A0A4Z2GYV0_9TELE|nr:hypothetical protein EYF80_031968 [Liparis tanakae]
MPRFIHAAAKSGLHGGHTHATPPSGGSAVRSPAVGRGCSPGAVLNRNRFGQQPLRLRQLAPLLPDVPQVVHGVDRATHTHSSASTATPSGFWGGTQQRDAIQNKRGV